jgi:hypothetical protein
MQSVMRNFLSEARLKEIINHVKANQQRSWLTLNHGPGWTDDFSKEQEAIKEIKVYEDWPHAGNGFTVDGFIVEVHYYKFNPTRDSLDVFSFVLLPFLQFPLPWDHDKSHKNLFFCISG